MYKFSRKTRKRFWSKVDKKSSPNGCWLWTGCLMKGNSYGQFHWLRKTRNCHQLSWIMKYGKIPKGMWVLHDCPEGDNPSCVNPDHLWLGTAGDNNRDLVKKGKHCSNNPKWCAKISRVRKLRLSDPKERAKLTAINRAKAADLAFCAKLSSSIKESWKDPKIRAKRIAGMRKAKGSNV